MDEAVDGDGTAGIIGTNGTELPTLGVVGDTLVVGTAAGGLTPRLPISVEPNGTPARAAPLDVVGDIEVGDDDAAMLPEPEPHIPDNPDVSSMPEDVDTPDVAEIADDVDIPDVAMVPDVAPAAGVAVPVAIAIPPPS
jgi:hypothetical protein